MDVTFVVTVFNQGTVQATTIVFNDYIPAGFVLCQTELNWKTVSASLATGLAAGSRGPPGSPALGALGVEPSAEKDVSAVGVGYPLRRPQRCSRRAFRTR